MKSALTIAGAGAAFAGTVIAALALGIWLDARFGGAYYVALAFFAGLAIGGYAAYRLIAQALRT